MLRRVADLFPLTWLGILVALGAWAALERLAYAELDLVWLVVGFALLGLVGASLLSVTLTALALALTMRRRRRGPAEPHAMDTRLVSATGFDTPTFWFLPLVQIDWTWERPEDVEVSIETVRGRMREKVKLRDRGHVEEVRRRLVIQDPFGLARLAIRPTERVQLTVRPNAGKLGDTPMLVSVSGGDERPHPMGIDDGDRVELRRYAPGDPARFIHWKVYGRTRKLMVRMPERALSPARRTVAYLVAGPDDDASAAAARVAVESGVFGSEWTFSADGASKDTSRVDEAVEMIVASIAARGRGGAGLEPFLSRAERAGPASSVIFVPARPGPWLDHVSRAVRARAIRTRVVITTDGIDARPEAPWWRRWLVLPDPREGTPSADLDRVAKALAGTRVEVIVLDRKSGKRLGERHRAAMRAAEGKRAA
ncbi:MAG: DUF58 domain-containing protein [Sandaracinaceae bacterium]|nr:DUF58 domain-containing protein [Sandaracinaceae bacterium]